MKKTQVKAKTKSSDSSNQIILFDMDGTLTHPREEMESFMVKKLRQLSMYTKLGIVSGSDFDYIMQQCKIMFETGGVALDRVDILPCNGTKFLKWEQGNHKLIHEADMLAEIGAPSYKKIMKWLFNHQAEISMLYPDVNFTGTFFQYRGSLLNWCPIGRIANDTLRYGWTCQDNEWKIREIYMEKLQKYLKAKKIPVTVALGGATSFDIYPDGWDKTYALDHYKEYEVFFIGDRCDEGGNDWHIYHKLKSTGKSYITTGPRHTTEIIDDIMKRL